jgi:hypothetical protein
MAEEPTSPSVELKSCCAEVEVYLHLLLVIFLIDKKLYDLATSTSVTLIERILAINSRNLDQIAAKAYFYYSRRHLPLRLGSRLGSSGACREEYGTTVVCACSLELNKRLSDARPTLLAAHRTACESAVRRRMVARRIINNTSRALADRCCALCL